MKRAIMSYWGQILVLVIVAILSFMVIWLNGNTQNIPATNIPPESLTNSCLSSIQQEPETNKYDFTTFTQENPAIITLRSVPAYDISIGEGNIIGITASNGSVKIKDGVTVDAASREFWTAIEKMFPYMFGTNHYIITTKFLIVTNMPKQWRNSSQGCLAFGCTQDHSFWQDTPTFTASGTSDSRDNPDVRIEETHSIRQLEFDFEKRHFVELLEDKIVSTRKFTRTVTEEWSENSK